MALRRPPLSWTIPYPHAAVPGSMPTTFTARGYGRRRTGDDYSHRARQRIEDARTDAIAAAARRSGPTQCSSARKRCGCAIRSGPVCVNRVMRKLLFSFSVLIVFALGLGGA